MNYERASKKGARFFFGSKRSDSFVGFQHGVLSGSRVERVILFDDHGVLSGSRVERVILFDDHGVLSGSPKVIRYFQHGMLSGSPKVIRYFQHGVLSGSHLQSLSQQGLSNIVTYIISIVTIVIYFPVHCYYFYFMIPLMLLTIGISPIA
ncbi:MAG: hypothetical protein KJO05_01345 [Bacteroidia bacterium]|nr:hypothetical protein [Bacteroidia bacterium]